MDSKLIAHLQTDYPQFKFTRGAKFAYRPPKTIIIGPPEANSDLLLLHELGHALNKHYNFNTDIERLKMEVEAWEKARELAHKYQVEFKAEVMDSKLDTYRDWLHQKSRCPKCGLTRFETPDGQYHCPKCEILS